MVPEFMDEIDCGSFFDQIDDILDFPTEDVDAPLPTVGNCDSLPHIWTTESDSVFSHHSASHLSAELSVPYEDIFQLEWMSKFVEDSFEGESLTMKKEDISSDTSKEESGSQILFQTSSPVSVLESSSSYSGEKPAGYTSDVLAAGRCGRARSKRPRPATFVPRLVEPKKNTKFTPPLAPAETKQNSVPQAVRKCLHCEITKTPQWRAGPLGPKTLCNACGVRYKSGRLFPEYRPAASPTFVPSIHSNSHKKVLEMRNNPKGNAMNSSQDFSELIPNTNSSLPLDYM